MKDVKIPERRIARMRISLEELFSTLIEGKGFFVEKSALKPGVKFLGIDHDFSSRSYYAILEHESFPVCQEGAIPHELEPVVLKTLENAYEETEKHRIGN